MSGKYAVEHQSARADLSGAGTAVVFELTTAGAYDPVADTETGATTSRVPGVAMRVTPNPQDIKRFQEKSLVVAETPLLLFVADTYGDVVPMGASCTWEGQRCTVRDVNPLAPDGVHILARVAVRA